MSEAGQPILHRIFITWFLGFTYTYVFVFFVLYNISMYFHWVPGVVPLDPGRDSAQNDGRMTSVALIWVPFVPKHMLKKTL